MEIVNSYIINYIVVSISPELSNEKESALIQSVLQKSFRKGSWELASIDDVAGSLCYSSYTIVQDWNVPWKEHREPVFVHRKMSSMLDNSKEDLWKDFCSTEI